MAELNSSVRSFCERSQKYHVMKAKSIVSISILICVLFISIVSIPVPFVLADPGISYTIQAREKGGTWTSGSVSGYDECEDVPLRIIISYSGVTVTPKDETSQIVSLEGAFKDSDSPYNYGLDYFKDFGYTDTGGLDGTPTVDGHALPWAAGAGTVISEVNVGPIKNLKYILYFELTAGSTGTLTITWKAHLAKGGENGIPVDRGARNWIGPPAPNLQVSADPPSGGEKTVNIQTPGSITAAATTDTTTETTETTTDTTTETTETTTDTATKVTESTETIQDYDDPFVSAPVGGYVMPVNKLLIMSPYIVILGIITTLLTILKMYVRRKD